MPWHRRGIGTAYRPCAFACEFVARTKKRRFCRTCGTSAWANLQDDTRGGLVLFVPKMLQNVPKFFLLFFCLQTSSLRIFSTNNSQPRISPSFDWPLLYGSIGMQVCPMYDQRTLRGHTGQSSTKSKPKGADAARTDRREKPQIESFGVDDCT